MLSIYEETFLLALDEEKGNILPFTKRTLAYGLAGGILAELTLMGKVDSNEKHRLKLVEDTSTGDPILDEAIQEIHSSEKSRKLTYWISQFSAKPKKLRERIGEQLVARELLYQEDRRYFWKPSSIEEGLLAAPSKFEIKYPLRQMIFSEDESDERSLALLNIASASDLLNLIFTQDELPAAKARIHEKVIRTALENPVLQTIEEIEQAIISSMDDDND
jgi:Golgi phosphoprotein 3